MEMKQKMMALNQDIIEIKTELAQKDSSFETKLKELKKLQFDTEAMK